MANLFRMHHFLDISASRAEHLGATALADLGGGGGGVATPHIPTLWVAQRKSNRQKPCSLSGVVKWHSPPPLTKSWIHPRALTVNKRFNRMFQSELETQNNF